MKYLQVQECEVAEPSTHAHIHTYIRTHIHTDVRTYQPILVCRYKTAGASHMQVDNRHGDA